MDPLPRITLLLWLATLIAALHLRQPPGVRSWQQTGSGTVQFLALLSLTVSAVVPPPGLTPWTRWAWGLIALLPLLLLGDAVWQTHRNPLERPPSAASLDRQSIDR